MTTTFPKVSEEIRTRFGLNSESQITEMHKDLVAKIGKEVEVMHFGEYCKGIVKEVSQDEHCFIILTELNQPALSDWDGNYSKRDFHMINKLDNRGLSTIRF